MTQESPIIKETQETVLTTLIAHVKEACRADVVAMDIADGELVLRVRRANIVEILGFLRDDPLCQFKVLVDICGVDWLEDKEREGGRFDVVYHLLSINKNMRLRVKVRVPDEGGVPTVTDVFSSANWFERECYDLFGIVFEGHPDLRRILTDYGFEGHPLRKDFPVFGKREVYYDETQQRVVYKPVDMPQEFREFNRASTWASEAQIGLGEEESIFDQEEFNRA